VLREKSRGDFVVGSKLGLRDRVVEDMFFLFLPLLFLGGLTKERW